MQRYFAHISDGKAFLSKLDEHHLRNVVRIRENENIIVIDQGKEYLATVSKLSSKELQIDVLKQNVVDVELLKKVTLFFALAKGDKIDFVIQKATELGVNKIVLVNTSRCIVKLSNEDFIRKVERYNLIAKEAAEQSHRVLIPEIQGVVDVNHIPNEYLCDINYVAYESEAGLCTQLKEIKDAKSISILIGPEGGLSEEEVLNLKNSNFKPVSLGKRILRTETAAITALSVIDYLIEQ